MVDAGGGGGYIERRKDDRPGCSECGGDIVEKIALMGEVYEGCAQSGDIEHDWTNRRKSTKCGCGKWNCPVNVSIPGSHEGVPTRTCDRHGDPVSDVHHTDGTQACKTNHRTPEEEVKWQADHAKWEAIRKKLPDLAAVLNLLDIQANPLSFDGHDNYNFVVMNTEAAAICIHHMYDFIRGIQVGELAMSKLPKLKER